MQDIRLICIDIDGTLLDSCHQLPPENRAAVLWAEKQGAAICLMTARPPGATVSIQQALDIQGPIACFGGGLLEYQGERLCDVRVPVQAAALLVQECAAKQIHLSIYRGSGWYIGCCDKWSAQESQITGLTPMCANLGNTIHTWGSHGAHKLLCMGQPEQLDCLYKALEAHQLGIQLLRSKDTYLEIMPQGAGKAQAMGILCRQLGITPAQVMALGDQDVDASMLRAAGFGVAMGNSSPAAWQAAAYHTDTNDHAGVAKAIYEGFTGKLSSRREETADVMA